MTSTNTPAPAAQSTPKHTAGPWRWIADVELGRAELWPVDDPGDGPITTVETTDWIGVDTDPNLRLIASAPKLAADNAALLAALEACFARLQRKADTCKDASWKAADQDAYDLARAAIQQTRGDA